MARKIVSTEEAFKTVSVSQSIYGFERIKNLKGSLAMPSYVHGYSLGIEYMYNWFKNKFDREFFKGGIYIDGKNVLDDYKRLNEFSMKNIIKGQNPRARMGVNVEYDYDRDGLDLYQAPPEVLLKRSNFQQAFFKDYDRDMFLGFALRGMRMDFGFKVRLNSRSQQLDTYNRMELYFRNGATQQEYISADIHVPKYIMLNIARKAGFEVREGEVVDIIEFIQYLNRHSDIPFLFKLRAINQKSEFFIRLNNLYTHIAVRDKLQLDDGERDGKLDFNFNIEMAAILDMPVPHYYTFYSAEDMDMDIQVKETDNCVAIYSINIYEIPKTNELGWDLLANTDYQTDKGDTEIDISTLFEPQTPIGRAINHDLAIGVSPSKFLDIKLIRDDDLSKNVDFNIDWEKKVLKLVLPEEEEILHIVIYADKIYLNELTSELGKYKENRISNNQHNSN